MPELQVKKVVAVCFLESAKLSLEHLGEHRLELSQKGLTGPEELPRIYGGVRRLRDYMQRSVSGYQDLVQLDLSEQDASLLVGCCRRSVEAIESRLVDGDGPSDESQWLGKKRQVLADWAVEMAAKPLLELRPVIKFRWHSISSKLLYKDQVSLRCEKKSAMNSPL